MGGEGGVQLWEFIVMRGYDPVALRRNLGCSPHPFLGTQTSVWMEIFLFLSSDQILLVTTAALFSKVGPAAGGWPVYE